VPHIHFVLFPQQKMISYIYPPQTQYGGASQLAGFFQEMLITPLGLYRLIEEFISTTLYNFS